MPILMESGKQTCLICLRNNYDDTSLLLYDMCLEMEHVTYLNKLEFVLNAEIVVYDSTLICQNCLNDLNNAYDFKERVNKALEYWSVRFEAAANIDRQTEVVDVINEGDNNEVDKYAEVRVIENGETTELCVLKSSEELNNSTEPTADNATALNTEIDHEKGQEALNNDNKQDNPLDTSFFECFKCSNMFLTTTELLNHSCVSKIDEKIDNNVSKDNDKDCKEKKLVDEIRCELCDLDFTTLSKLNKHRKAKHRGTETKKFVCTYCNHAFKQSYHLREHLTSHTGEHNFMCNVCGKTFQRISSQRRHMKTHDALPGQKSKKSPFLCNICGKRFPYSNGAQRHMRIHTGDRRYECKVCNKRFSQSTHLKVHLRTHTGERPYMCNICGESFTIKASLHKHVTKGHDSKDIEVKILHNLEPNLSRTESLLDEEDIKKDEYLVDGILYDP